MSSHELPAEKYPEERVSDISGSQLDDLDEGDFEDYAAWAAELENTQSYSHHLELSEEATQDKLELSTQLDKILTRLASDEVQSKGHYNPGGGAEVVDEMIKLQLQELPKIYAGIHYESDFLRWHARQKTENWCQLASMQNAFTALGDSSVTQEGIAQKLHIHPDGRPFPDDLMQFARDKGMDVKKLDSVTEMIDLLASSSKIILNTGYPVVPIQHAILISGVRINHGEIEFFYNDSASDDGVKTVHLERMLKLFEPPLAHNTLNRSYAISRASGSSMPAFEV